MTNTKAKHEIIALVGSFEDASIARGVWKHAEHLVVALYYVTKYDLETATAQDPRWTVQFADRGL